MQSKWSEEEKHKMLQFMEENKDNKRKNWISCSQLIGSKAPRQCYDFYTLQQKQETQQSGERHKWEPEEIEKLLRQPRLGLPWKDFQQIFFPTLTICQLKNKLKYVQSNEKKIQQKVKGKITLVQKTKEEISLNQTPVCSQVAQVHTELSAPNQPIYEEINEMYLPLFNEQFDQMYE